MFFKEKSSKGSYFGFDDGKWQTNFDNEKP